MSPIALPPGVEVPIDFPPFSYYPLDNLDIPPAGCDSKRQRQARQRFIDQTDAIIAAVNTPHFPVLRSLHHSQINKRLAAWQL